MIGCVTDFLTIRRKAPWFVLGTGPTSDSPTLQTWADSHFTLTLARACKLVKPTLALFMDLEPYAESRAAGWLADDTPVCLPWHPHVACEPSRRSLRDYAHITQPWHEPAVSWALARDTLYSFNSTTAGKLSLNVSLPIVRVRYFSAVAAFNLLAYAGVREVYTLGVDGGTGYGSAFDPKDRLRNGREDFDAQFKEIEATCRKHKIRWTKLAW